MLRFFLFRQFQILRNDVPVDLPARTKTQALLAYLLLHRQQPVLRDRVAFALWTDETEQTARANLRRHLYNLRQALPDVETLWAMTGRRTIEVCHDASYWLDVAEFETASQTPATWRQAVSLYKGDLLAGVDDDWIFYERERLREVHLKNLTQLIVYEQQQGNYLHAISYAQQLLLEDPLREDTVRQLMTLLYQHADRSGALAAYRQFAARLRDELGVAPMPETTLLYERLLRNQAPEQISTPADSGSTMSLDLPFVGRELELAELQTFMERAAQGAGKVVFIGGEAGIGKTRLINEFIDSTEDQGIQILNGQTSPVASYAYEPFLAALRPVMSQIAARSDDVRWLSALLPLLPQLRHLHPAISSLPELEPEQEQNRLFEAFTRCLETLTQNAPVLLVLEDIHRATAETTHLIAHLSRHLHTIPVLLIATCREEEIQRDHPLHALLYARQHQHVALLSLDMLTAPALQHMLEKMAMSSATTTNLAAMLQDYSEGHPLFIRELLRDWLERGKLTFHQNRFHLHDADLTTLPLSVQELIQSRIKRLSEPAQVLAEICAIAGSTFDVALLREASGWKEADILDSLHELQDHHLIQEAPVRHLFDFAFTHHLIQATLYKSIDADRRTRRHYRIAEVMAELESYQSDELAASVARHYDCGGKPHLAAQHYYRAAQHAVSVYAYHTALQYLQQALSIAHREPAFSFDLSLLHNDILQRQGQHSEQQADLDHLDELAARLNDPECRATALHRRVIWLYGQGEFEEVKQVAGELQQHAQAHHLKTWGLQALVSLADAAAHLDDYDQSYRLANEALAGYQQCDDKRGQVLCYQVLASAAIQQGNLEGAFQYIEQGQALDNNLTEVPLRIKSLSTAVMSAHIAQNYTLSQQFGQQLLDLSLRAGDRNGQAYAHAYLAMAKTRFFDVVAARQHYQQANMLFRLLGNDTRAAAILLNSTILTLQVGLLEATRTTLHEARTIFEAAQDIRGQAICAINMSLVLQLEEKPAPALEEAQRGLALTEQIENDYLAATALSNISSSHMMLGNYQQAINFMQQALEMRCNQGAQEVSIIEELRDLALAHLDAGDVPQAQQTIDEMLARREKSTQPLSYESYCLWVAALVYRRNGNESRSDALLQTAYKTMQETADRIPDETTRQAFLDLFFHRRIQRAYHQGTWPE